MDGLVVIVGGSGFLGRYVVQQLAQSGMRMRVVVRRPEAAAYLKPLGALGQIQIVDGDVRDTARLAQVFQHATAGVNLVGILAEAGKQTFAAVQAAGAGNVARAAAEAGVGAFVQVSAIGASMKSAARYAKSKAAGEAAVLTALPHATILRPSLVFGPEDQFINRFAALAKALPAVPVVAGNTKFQPVYVLDVAKAIVAALSDPARFGGQTFELGGPRVYAFRDIIAWIMREIRVTKPMIEVPPFAAKLMARVGDIVPGAPMTTDQWTMLQSDNIAASDGLAALGIAATPLEVIAPQYLERYRTGGRFHRDAPASG